jgi:hypothetical protein
MIDAIQRMYGRPVGFHPGPAPGSLGGFTDDIEAQLQSKATGFAQTMANEAYDQVKHRFEQDKDQLATEVVDAAKPKVLAAVQEILSDANTQQRIGEAKASFRNTLIVVVGVATVAGSALTFVMLRPHLAK